MWTLAPRLSHLNGGRWIVSGEVNTIKEIVEVRGNFTILSALIRSKTRRHTLVKSSLLESKILT
jgi:hypothetical protein